MEHFGQWDAGKAMDCFSSGRRRMTTFKKEPTAIPKRKADTEKMVSMLGFSVIVVSGL